MSANPRSISKREMTEHASVVDSSVAKKAVSVANHGLLDAEAVAWLAGIDTNGRNDRQRLGLAFVRRKDTLTNRRYRTLNGCDAREVRRTETTPNSPKNLRALVRE